jgi:hypothetical protein
VIGWLQVAESASPEALTMELESIVEQLMDLRVPGL